MVNLRHYHHSAIMPKLSIRVLLVATLLIQCSNGLFDPIATSVGVGVGAVLGYNFNFIKEHTYCKLKECCNDEYIPRDISQLERELKSNLFGQHIVIQHLVPVLKAHFSKDVKPKKALVLSFHGPPGTGKNYVSGFIAKSLYKRGLESRFVHIYKGTLNVNPQLSDELRAAISDCPRSLFIFDSVEMQKGILESLRSLVDYNSHEDGANYGQAIFVLLSNTAEVEISLRLKELLRSGTLREATEMRDFEKILERRFYNLDGDSTKKAELNEAHVVDHFIPFLPLEKKQVYQCIEAEFKRWNKCANPRVIERIIRDSVSFDKKSGLFAISGCKALEKRVAVAVVSN